jgi:ribose 5-phosphate isomerase B
VTDEEDVSSWKAQHKGILFCRSAAGMVIAANKVQGIRAVGVFDEKQAVHSRTNNDANILGISGDWTDENSAKQIIKKWLATDFSGDERHKRRIAQIADMESTCCGEC